MFPRGGSERCVRAQHSVWPMKHDQLDDVIPESIVTPAENAGEEMLEEVACVQAGWDPVLSGALLGVNWGCSDLVRRGPHFRSGLGGWAQQRAEMMLEAC